MKRVRIIITLILLVGCVTVKVMSPSETTIEKVDEKSVKVLKNVSIDSARNELGKD